MDEIDALTKRFKDYIDKVQAAADAERKKFPENEERRNAKRASSDKLYTVVSPVETVADNLKSVLRAIDNAIDNIEELSQPSPRDQVMMPSGASKDVYSSLPRQKKFTDEELDFLVKTFNKILNTSEEERRILFRQFDKINKPSDV